MNVHELFEKHEDEFLKDETPGKRDLRAFNLLDKKFPGSEDIVCSAAHDVIWLFPTIEQLETLSEEDVIYLLRNGVFFDNNIESLQMFV